MGCLRPWSVAEAYPMPPGQTEQCLTFILGLSVPLSLVFIVMLRRGFSLRPRLTAIVGGLACASAAATLLNFIHPYDAAAADLAVHALAIAIVIVANAILGGRILISNSESQSSLAKDKAHVVKEHRDQWFKHLRS
jgi:heme/copper-type cytochrome/quinol oxidase subunit 4